MGHLGSHRHLGSKRQYVPVFRDGEKPPEPKSRHSHPDALIGGLPKPHKRFRPDEAADEPWRFSPSEAEHQDRYQRSSSPPRDDGFDYNDDVGGGDDYRDDDSPPPPAPTTFPTLSLPFALPKPVPIVLPKPVPIINRNPDPPSAG